MYLLPLSVYSNGSGGVTSFLPSVEPINHTDMEAVIKINILDGEESDWVIEDYANGKFANLTDEDLVGVISQIIYAAIEDNAVYFDYDDADRTVREIRPTISSIILNPLFSHIRSDYNSLVELITYLTTRLA